LEEFRKRNPVETTHTKRTTSKTLACNQEKKNSDPQSTHQERGPRLNKTATPQQEKEAKRLSHQSSPTKKAARATREVAEELVNKLLL